MASRATVSCGVTLYWSDPRLAWDPEDFGGLTETRVFTDPETNFNYIWVPDIEGYENFNP